MNYVLVFENKIKYLILPIFPDSVIYCEIQ